MDTILINSWYFVTVLQLAEASMLISHHHFAKPGTSVAAVVMFMLLLVVSFLYIRKRRQYKMTSSSKLLMYTMSGGTPRSRGSTDMESGSVHKLQTHHFSYEELEEATGGFSVTGELGDGGFGTVYKGKLLHTGKLKIQSSTLA
jgi:hypothetical protein